MYSLACFHLDDLKTKARNNIQGNRIKDLIDFFKRKYLNVQKKILGWAINKVFFISVSILHCYKVKVWSHDYISQITF